MRLRSSSVSLILIAVVAALAAGRAAGQNGRSQGDPRQYPPPRSGGVTNSARPAAIVPRPPFQLSRAEEQFRDRVLLHWEKESAKVETFASKFKRYEYDPIWGPRNFREAKTESDGEIKYAAPDKGMFRITAIRHHTPPERPGEKPRYVAKEGEFGEHWVCDGRSIWQYDFRKRHLVEHPLPPEMQGKQIVNGPLPFLFGAKMNEMKQRYWLRIVTPKNLVQEQIWLEAFPRYQRDAANFQRVELILNIKTFLPAALQVYLPNGKSRTVYSFYAERVNDPFRFLQGDFTKPDLPRGWKKVIESPPDVARRDSRPTSPGNQAPPSRGGQGQRPTQGAFPRR